MKFIEENINGFVFNQIGHPSAFEANHKTARNPFIARIAAIERNRLLHHGFHGFLEA